MKDITRILQCSKEMKSKGGSATFYFVEKHFHTHAMYTDFFTYNSFYKQGNLN